MVVLTGQEAVKLDEQLQVDVVALWRLAVRAANMVLVKIDTYLSQSSAHIQYALCVLVLRLKTTSQRSGCRLRRLPCGARFHLQFSKILTCI